MERRGHCFTDSWLLNLSLLPWLLAWAGQQWQQIPKGKNVPEVVSTYKSGLKAFPGCPEIAIMKASCIIKWVVLFQLEEIYPTLVEVEKAQIDWKHSDGCRRE